MLQAAIFIAFRFRFNEMRKSLVPKKGLESLCPFRNTKEAQDYPPLLLDQHHRRFHLMRKPTIVWKISRGIACASEEL